VELLEIHADAAGETHFRRLPVPHALRDFAPPSPPVGVSAEMAATTVLFLAAPQGWDTAPHPTPRRQLAVVLEGEGTVTASDGETIALRPGAVVLLNDAASKGHLTRVASAAGARFLLVGLAD